MTRVSVQSNAPPPPLWIDRKGAAQRDYIIKKIATGVIGIMNLAGILFLLTYLSQQIPISTTPLLISPFIFGIIGALTYLKIPTFGVGSSNLRDFTNPAALMARAMTFVLFGPFIVCIKWLDWTNYGDHYKASEIKQDFQKEHDLNTIGPFVHDYRKKIPNLVKYGLLTSTQGTEITEKFNANYRDIRFLKKHEHVKGSDPQKINHSLENIRTFALQWNEYKKQLTEHLPTQNDLNLPTPEQLSTRSGRIKAKIQKHVGLYTFS